MRITRHPYGSHWVWVTLLLVSFADQALATTGGPEVAEILGWDPVDKKVFFAIHHHDESGRFPTVLYFALEAVSPSRAVVVPWTEGAIWNDSTLGRVEKLRHRLHRLRDKSVPEMPRSPFRVEADSIRDATGVPRARFTVKGTFHHEAAGVEFEVVTYGDPSVHLSHVYSIPGRRERILVVSFRGIPHEEGYETQVPVLLPDGAESLPRIEWRRRW